MGSIGLHLNPWLKRGLLRFHSARPTLYGLEMHLATMYKEIEAFRPSVVILDPMTSLLVAGSESETKSMVTRLIDYLKSQGITSLFTSLTHVGNPLQQSEITISSLMDSWLLLQDIEGNGERNRVLYVLKARGMAHSNQSREFLISDRGIELLDAYIGPGGVLTGAARAAQSAQDKARALAGQQEAARGERDLERRHVALEARIAAQRSEYEAEKEELRRSHEQVATRSRVVTADRTELASLRHADAEEAVRTRPKPIAKKRKR
jgi:circadian clock protein KaiC